MMELNECRKAYGEQLHPRRRLRFDQGLGVGRGMSFIVNRPAEEPGFRLERQERDGRSIRYTTMPYATDRPEGERSYGPIGRWDARRSSGRRGVLMPHQTCRPADTDRDRPARGVRGSGVEEVLDELDRELIGLAPVKKRIRETAALLLVERRARRWASPTRRRRCT